MRKAKIWPFKVQAPLYSRFYHQLLVQCHVYTAAPTMLTMASFPSTLTIIVRVPICAKDTSATRQPDSSFRSGNSLLLGYDHVGRTFRLGRRLHLATRWEPINGDIFVAYVCGFHNWPRRCLDYYQCDKGCGRSTPSRPNPRVHDCIALSGLHLG